MLPFREPLQPDARTSSDIEDCIKFRYISAVDVDALSVEHILKDVLLQIQAVTCPPRLVSAPISLRHRDGIGHSPCLLCSMALHQIV